jgi:hypothetical protein
VQALRRALGPDGVRHSQSQSPVEPRLNLDRRRHQEERQRSRDDPFQRFEDGKQ